MPIEIAMGLGGTIIGAVIGSYLSTSALRWSRGQGASFGRSYCDHCQAPLSFFETVPVLSSLVLKGQCRTCHSPIDRFHLTGEIGGAVLLGLVFALRPWPMAALEGAMALLLLWLALIDIKTFTLPNLLVLVVAALGAVIAFSEGTLVENGLVALGLGLILSAVAWGLSRFKGQVALGAGDIKLVIALTLWLGVSSIYLLILASLLGLVHFWFSGMKTLNAQRIPFGPSLAVSGLIIGLIVMPMGWGAA